MKNKALVSGLKKTLLLLTLAAGLAVSGIVRADDAKPVAAPAAVAATKPAEAYRLLAQSTTGILDFFPDPDELGDGSMLLAQSTTNILDFFPDPDELGDDSMLLAQSTTSILDFFPDSDELGDGSMLG